MTILQEAAISPEPVENPSLMLQFRYGKKSTKRQAEGTDDLALPGQVSGQPDMEYAMVDATIVKVHRHSQGAKGGLKARP